MSSTAANPWTQAQFLDWASAREERYEFDGFRPVAMTGGNAGHNRICHNLNISLGTRLRGAGCSSFGPDLGVSTVGNAIRYPDALITRTKFPLADMLAPNPVAVFEVLSPHSGGVDRIVKLREYRAVASIRRYVIVESAAPGVTVFEKAADGSWRASSLTAEDTLDLPEAGIAIPVAGLYLEVPFADGAGG
jgi:Uma2 family endonuclease